MTCRSYGAKPSLTIVLGTFLSGFFSTFSLLICNLSLLPRWALCAERCAALHRRQSVPASYSHTDCRQESKEDTGTSSFIPARLDAVVLNRIQSYIFNTGTLKHQDPSVKNHPKKSSQFKFYCANVHTLPVSLQTCQRGQEVLSRIRRLLLFRAGVHKVPHVCTSEWLLFLKFLYCVLGWTPVVLCLFLNVQILISSVCKSIEGNRALSQSLRGGGNYAKKDHDTDRQTDRQTLPHCPVLSWHQSVSYERTHFSCIHIYCMQVNI